MKLKRLLACMTAIFLCLTGVVALAEEVPEISGDLVFWNLNAGSGGRDEAFAAMIELFMEKYPNVNVIQENFPASESTLKLQLAASSNDLPDVVGIVPSAQSILYGMDMLVPLDDYLATSEHYQDVLPSLVEVNRSYWPDGKLYGMPANAQLQILWYRPDLFDAPKTWDEFYSTIANNLDRENDTYGYIIRGADTAEVTLSFCYAYSGIKEFFREDGTCTLNDPLHAEALEKYLSMYNVYTAESDITAGFQAMTIAFGSGSARMFLHNTGSYTDHLKNLGVGHFGATVFPESITGEIVIPDLGSPAYVMCKTDRANTDAAFALIDFFSSAEMQTFYHQAVGTVPVNVKCFEEDWAKERVHYQLVQDVLTNAQGNTAMVAFPVYLPDFSSIMSSIGVVGIQEIMYGTGSAQQLLDELAHAFEVSYQEYLTSL